MITDDLRVATGTAPLHELVAARAVRDPEKVAVRDRDGSVTYAELNRRANAVARSLLDRGLRPGDVVGVRVERGAGLVVTLLGVARAGLTYLPLDPDHPEERIAYVLADSGAVEVLTDVPSDGIDDHVVPPSSGGLAYLIYTSGSTGRPKGVMIPHGAVTALLESMRRRPGLTADDTLVAVTTVAFDISVVELFLPLTVGATVVVASREQASDPELLGPLLADSGATVMQATPATWRMLLASGWRPPAGFRAWCGGELMPPDLAQRFVAEGLQVWDLYGPTETTVWSAVARLGSEGGLTDWAPLDGEQVHVLGPDLAPAVPGATGEVCISGAGLAWGYAGRPSLTAQRFVPWPGGIRLYRTGDVGRRHPDGRVEILGRTDHQVKINGHRIELGEVESVLADHPAVDAVVVHPHTTEAGHRQLVAYLVGTAPPGTAELRAHLAVRLPDYMIPAFFRWLPQLPLTVNGKVDRAALPAPGDRDHLDQPYEAPADDVEKTLADMWCRLLEVAQVGRHDDFFHLGGDSLQATRLVGAVRAATGASLTVTQVFAARTLAGVARLITAGPTAPMPAPARRADDSPSVMASSGQRALWFLNQLDPTDTAYHEQLVVRLTGRLDEQALAAALSDVVARHEVLRTRYVTVDGEPVPVIDPPRPVELRTGTAAGTGWERLVEEQHFAPFDLASGPVLRAGLVRVGTAEHVLSLTIHHIACDERSLAVLADDLAAAYAARLDGEAPRPASTRSRYTDFAAWQQDWLATDEAGSERAFWRDQLTGRPPLDLPVDHPRSGIRDTKGDAVAFTVPSGLAERLAEVAKRHQVTTYMLGLAACQVLLSRYTGSLDVAIGTPTSGRDHPDLDDVIGYFVNNIVVRTNLDGGPTFTEVLARARRAALAAMDHRRLPFDAMVAEVAPDRDRVANPLFDVMFAYLDTEHPGLTLRGLDSAPMPALRRDSEFDLTFELVRQKDNSLVGKVEYRTSLFDVATAERMAGHFLRLLESVAAAPDHPIDRLPILPDAERTALRALAGERTTPPGDLHPLERFEAWARQTPDAVAVLAADATHTYGETDARAERLADELVAAGVRPGTESRVAVFLERGVDAVVAFLAVMKVGAVFCPVAPQHPADRRRLLLAELAPDVIVTRDCFADQFAELAERVNGHCVESEIPVVRTDAPVAVPQRARSPLVPGQAAYIIFTSGSTGRPKGVVVSHDALAHHCAAIVSAYDLRQDDRALLLASLIFDPAIEEICAPLVVGATIVVSDAEPWLPETLLDRIAEFDVTYVEMSPGYYRELMAVAEPADPRLARLRIMNLFGDRVTANDVRTWAESGQPGRLLCTYGPTETTITATVDESDRAVTAQCTIGKPVAGTRAYVLDRAMNLLPIGVPGELYLGGPRLARGYLGRPGPTAERFVPDPFGERSGDRLYRTGDVVRWRSDGTLEFLGRTDDQIKIRGHRVEAGEVEARLNEHPHVVTSAVVAKEILGPEDIQLVAYVVLIENSDRDSVELRAFLADRLPDYLLPTQWVAIPSLPMTAAGKLDKAALPAPILDREILRTPFVPPTSSVERGLAEIWENILGIKNPGVHDNFFELGGHSLHVIKSLGRIKRSFPVELTVMDLFSAQSIGKLATVIEDKLTTNTAP